MKVIGFDIGINNLAYCVIDSNTLKILDWKIIQLKASGEKIDFETTSIRLLDAMHEHFGNDTNIGAVIIENQPVMKNPVMKSIQIMIYTYFIMMKRNKERNSLDDSQQMIVKLVSAQNKLKVSYKDLVDTTSVTTTDKYKRNKQLAIAYTQYFLNNTEQNASWKNMFENSKKKDDLSDSNQMIVWWIENNKK